MQADPTAGLLIGTTGSKSATVLGEDAVIRIQRLAFFLRSCRFSSCRPASKWPIHSPAFNLERSDTVRADALLICIKVALRRFWFFQREIETV
jgi:hypothetical protein